MDKQNQTITITKKPRFYNGITTQRPFKSEKLHNELIDQYEEIKPYTKNEQTGEFINPTNKYIYKKVTPKNIFKFIQSQAKDADIVSKIKNMTTLDLNKKSGVYIDTTRFGNIHEEHEKTIILEEELNKAEKEYLLKKEELKKQKIIEAYKEEEAKKAATAKETK